MDDDLLAETYGSLVDSLVGEYDAAEVLNSLAHACVQLLGAAEAGLLLLGKSGALQLVGSSSEPTRLPELFQVQTQEGPSLDSVRAGEPVVVADLGEARSRWPRFTTAALDAGFRSVQAVPMRLRAQTIGAMNLFHVETRSPGAEDLEKALTLAELTAIGILQQRSARRAAVLAGQLQTALDSRVIIEQAKGVLVGHAGISMDTAFDLLRGYAREHRRSLASVAEEVSRGEIPDMPGLRRRKPPGR